MADIFAPRAARHRLPDERVSITHKFSIAGHEGYITVGLYEDGTPGELFIVLSKQGSTLRGLLHAVGLLTSIALQSGVTVSELSAKFAETKFEPAGHSTNPEVGYAHSVLDYIFRWMEMRFGGGNKSAATSEALR